MKTQDALRYAQERDLDLVEVAPEAKPPVCRDPGLLEVQVRAGPEAEGRAQAPAADHVREIKFRPKIAQHDYDTKKGHVERFLKGATRSR